MQFERAGCSNAHLKGGLLQQACRMSREAEALLADAMDRFAMSARAYQRVLRVARTIADLGGQDKVDKVQMAEAISLRGMHRDDGLLQAHRQAERLPA